MDSDLVAALRARGVTIITALDAGLTEKPDEERLVFAAADGCTLCTFNVSDFYKLHTEWAEAGREHTGMILAAQQRYSVGEQLRRLLRLFAYATAARMRNRVEFLTNGDDLCGPSELGPDVIARPLSVPWLPSSSPQRK
jgi:hypothetical protein